MHPQVEYVRVVLDMRVLSAAVQERSKAKYTLDFVQVHSEETPWKAVVTAGPSIRIQP